MNNSSMQSISVSKCGEGESGVLYIVATPIGNLDDITYRAIEILKNVSLIACEDTRVSGKLLKHYNIQKPTTSVHQHTKPDKLVSILQKLESGEDVAYISDAGTPGVSDPGNKLVAAARKRGLTISPIPGPSAIPAILSVAGIDTQHFMFMAYPPHKKGRQTFFEKLTAMEVPVVYYDSVHRIVKNMDFLASFAHERRVLIGREVTKKFETFYSGTARDVADYLSENTANIKGEFVILVSP